MRKIAAAWLAFLLAMAAAGCTGGPRSAGPVIAAPPPRAGQELNLTIAQPPVTLDSALVTDSLSFDIVYNTMEGLVRLGEDLEPLPGMAERWDCDQARRECVFHLRRGARWSDGREVTARDFLFGWQRVLDPRTRSAYAYHLFYIQGAAELNRLRPDAPDFEARWEQARQQLGVEVADPYTLKVSLDVLPPYFLDLLASPIYLPQRQDVVERHGEQYARSPDRLVYNGPFLLTAVNEYEVIMEKNRHYWDAAAVRLDRVNWIVVDDAQMALTMYEVGELDEIWLGGAYIPAYAEHPEYHQLAEASTEYLVFNLRRPELQNQALRQAFHHAIDRGLYADVILGNGAVPAPGFVPPSIAGDDGRPFRATAGTLVPPRADPARARELWETARRELGVAELTVTILHPGPAGGPSHLQGIQAMLEDTLPGLAVTLEGVPFDRLLSRGRAGEFDLLYSGWIGDFNDPLTFLNLFVSGGAYNDGGWSNPRYDELIRLAESSPAGGARLAALAEAERMLLAEAPILPLAHGAVNRLRKGYVQGVINPPVGAGTELKYAFIEGKGQ